MPARPDPLPDPMLATLVADPFDNPAWAFEPKYDGLRVLARSDGRGVELMSRNRASQNGPFPDVVGDSQTVPATGRVTYTMHGAPHRYYVIWITRLGSSYRKATINTVSAN